MRITIELDNGLVTTHEVTANPGASVASSQLGATAPAFQVIDAGPAPGAGAAPGEATSNNAFGSGPGTSSHAGGVNAGPAPQEN